MATEAVTAVRITARDDASAVLKNLRGNLSSLQSSFISFRTALASVAGGVAGGAVLASFKSLIDSFDQLDEAAQSAGVTAESLQTIRYAASFAGVGAEQLDRALTKLNVTIAEAAAGNKQSADLFKTLGINVREQSGEIVKSDRALAQIAEKFAQYRDGANKAALAAALFGEKVGPKLIPFLNEGARGIEKHREELEKMGVLVGGQVVTAAAKFNDEMERLGTALQASKVALIGDYLPALTRYVENVLRARAVTQDWLLSLGAAASTQNLTDISNQIAQVTARLERDPGDFALNRRLRYLQASFEVVAARAKDAADKSMSLFVAGANALRASEPGGGRMGLPEAPKLPGRDGGERKKKEEIDEAQRALAQYVEQLERERNKVQELSIEMRVLNFLRANPGVDTPQVRQLLTDLERQAEAARETAEFLEEEKKARDAVTRAIEEQARRLKELTGEADIERLNRDLGILDRALNENRITLEQWIAGREKAFGVDWQKDIKESKSLVEELGLTFTSAFEDAIAGGRGLRDILKGIESDLLRLGTRKLVTEPLMEWFKGMMGSGSGGGFSGLGAILGAIFGGGKGNAEVFGDGGYIAPGTFGIVGERGQPEVVYGGRTGVTVQPMRAGNTINVTVHGSATRETANQIAASVSRQLAIANARAFA